MEFIGEVEGARYVSSSSGVLVLGVVVAVMDCAMNIVGTRANQLHDVYFPACGPSHVCLVLTEHPNRRPDALSKRQISSHIDAAVLEFLKPN